MNRQNIGLVRPYFWRIGLALGAFIAVISGFIGLAEEVHEGDTTVFDQAVLRSINSHATPAWDNFFTVITNLGGTLFVAALSLAVVAWLIWQRRLFRAVFVTTAIGGAAAINVILKLIFQRDRPELWQRIVNESSYSFPSGHAMGSSAFAFTVMILLWRTKFRWPALILGTMYIVLIGVSRLYLGVHYPTDIMAGWLVTFSWVMAAATIVSALYYRRHKTNAGAPGTYEIL